MRALILPLAALILAAGTVALWSRQSDGPRTHFDEVPLQPGMVRVPLDRVPPDACLELFGPGPCRPHGGMPTTGWTDAVAGPPPKDWRGKVR